MSYKKEARALILNNSKILLKSKRSQVTIFIIIAMLLVAAILIIFLFWNRPESATSTIEPQSYIESCIKDNVEDAVAILSKQGGDTNPELTMMYKGEKMTYLCYNQEFYKPCINQMPLLIEHEEKEITDYIKPKVEDCFSSLKGILEERGYEVTMGSMKVTTEMQTNRVVASVKRKFTMSRGEETQSFEEFNSKVSSPLYELSEIAMEVANQEAQYCNFENLGFMIIYPEYDVRKMSVDGSLIYTIKDLETQQEFKFAIRSCALPPGL